MAPVIGTRADGESELTSVWLHVSSTAHIALSFMILMTCVGTDRPLPRKQMTLLHFLLVAYIV